MWNAWGHIWDILCTGFNWTNLKFRDENENSFLSISERKFLTFVLQDYFSLFILCFETRTRISFFQSRVSKREREIENNFLWWSKKKWSNILLTRIPGIKNLRWSLVPQPTWALCLKNHNLQPYLIEVYNQTCRILSELKVVLKRLLNLNLFDSGLDLEFFGGILV